MFGNLFSNEAVKKTLLKQFAKKAQEQGIKRILVKIEGDEIDFEPLHDDLVLVEKKDYDFYREYFLTNINK
jgi:hypothetical protein